MNKHIFLQLEIKCGEYEFNYSGVHEISVQEDTIAFSEHFAREFYLNEPSTSIQEYFDRLLRAKENLDHNKNVVTYKADQFEEFEKFLNEPWETSASTQV